MSKLIQISESSFTEDVSSRIDRDNGVIRGVKIIGKISKNGRAYSDKALQKAVPLYEGKKVNIDHPDKGDEWKERSLLDSVGWLRNVSSQDDGLYGDFHFLKSHPSTSTIIEWAERNPDGFGLSHNAEGRMGKDRVVEVIESVRSVDLVGSPATTAGLFESVQEKPRMQTTLKKLVESHGSAAHKTNLKAFLEQESPDPKVKSVLESEFELGEPEDGAEFSKLLNESASSLVSLVMVKPTDIDEKMADVKAVALAEQFLRVGPQIPVETPASDDIEALRKRAAKADLLESQDRARDLLESAGVREIKKYQVVAVAAVSSPSERDALIESFKSPGGELPPASPRKSQPAGTDAPSWDEMRKKYLN